jgi:subtilisin family serine protease
MKENRPVFAIVVLALGVLLSLLLAIPGWGIGAAPGSHVAAAQGGSQPHIEIDSLSLAASAVEPGVVTRTLTLRNTGTALLQFQIMESSLHLAGPAAVFDPAGAIRILDAQVQVDPQIASELRAAGRTDFFVQMRVQADLSAAYHIFDWEERGRYVYEAVLAASRAQEPIIRYARARGLEVRTFLINNAVLVAGGTVGDVERLAARADVARLRAVRAYPLADSPAVATAPGGGAWASPDFFGWNLGTLDPNLGLFGTEAARVWQELGVRGACPTCGSPGSGAIVVGSIDTGVYYQHESLVRQYRGNVGDGTFIHDYNWIRPGLPACGDGSAPCDWSGHGTGTTGLVLGETEDLAEQIGVAPGAQWIACLGCDDRLSNVCTDDALLACADWMLAPTTTEGKSPNPALRPHIVNNSWGGEGCDPWFQADLEAWQAAGILPVFSAGNSALCGGLSDPGDLIPALGVAAHGITGRNAYAGGPSCHAMPPSCDPFLHEIKPNLNAPTSVRTAGRYAGYYALMSGTSAASPHAAGCAALLWSAQPALIGDLGATFTILEQTADRSLLSLWNTGGCGRPACAGDDPYPNNAYGWGYLDCYAAVDSLLVPWVSASPVSGSLAPGEERRVEVTFQCTPTSTLPLQPLGGTLRIKHNDPAQDPLNVDLSFLCMATNPVPRWERRAWINGQAAAVSAGPHAVRPGDTVVILDRVGATFSETITAALAASWSGSALSLLSAEAGAGDVIVAGDSLAWNLEDVAPNSTYVLTKTFQVQSGTWTTASVLESLTVEGATIQLRDVALELSHLQPPLTLAKTGPASGDPGERVGLTLTVGSDGAVRDLVLLTDPLPAGMSFAGNLAATYGTAWQQGATVYWQSGGEPAPRRADPATRDLLPALPAQVAITFDVLLDGSPGQLVRNTAVLDWGLGQTSASLEVHITAPRFLYLPLILHR